MEEFLPFIHPSYDVIAGFRLTLVQRSSKVRLNEVSVSAGLLSQNDARK